MKEVAAMRLKSYQPFRDVCGHKFLNDFQEFESLYQDLKKPEDADMVRPTQWNQGNHCALVTLLAQQELVTALPYFNASGLGVDQKSLEMLWGPQRTLQNDIPPDRWSRTSPKEGLLSGKCLTVRRPGPCLCLRIWDGTATWLQEVAGLWAVGHRVCTYVKPLKKTAKRRRPKIIRKKVPNVCFGLSVSHRLSIPVLLLLAFRVFC